jgi:hypothetical protein
MSVALVEKVLGPVLEEASRTGASAVELIQAVLHTVDRSIDIGSEAKANAAKFELAGRSGRAELLAREGGCVDAVRAAGLYRGSPLTDKSVHPEAVRKAAREGRLIGIRDGHGNLLFPVWQFSPAGAWPNLAPVLKILRNRPGHSEITPFNFFLQPHSRLGTTPLAAMREGRGEELLEAARMELD